MLEQAFLGGMSMSTRRLYAGLCILGLCVPNSAFLR
jgi:hypothetical protein